MLRYSFGLNSEAVRSETAVRAAIAAGARTGDIAGPGETSISTDEMAAEILRQL